MSQRFRFIDIVRPIMGILPEVEKPLKKVLYYSSYLSEYPNHISNIVTFQRQVDMDFNHSFHLFDLLLDTTLWHD
jgi:hypothetical protein